MLIWSGLGILVYVIGLVCYFGMNAIVGEQYMDSHGWPKSVALFVSAILVTGLGLYLRRKPGRVMIDKATGQEMTLKSEHTTLFIPVIYWGPILAAMAIYFLFVKYT